MLFINKYNKKDNNFLNILFIQTHNVNEIKTIKQKIADNNINDNGKSSYFHSLGKYDIVILEETKDLTSIQKSPILTDPTIQIKGWFPISAVEFYSDLDLKNSNFEVVNSENNELKRGFEISETEIVLVTLINLQDFINLNENISNTIFRNLNDSSKVIDTKSFSDFSRFCIIEDLIQLAYEKQIEMRIFGGFGRNEIIILTNLTTSDSNKLQNAESIYYQRRNNGKKTTQKPVTVAWRVTNLINQILPINKNLATILPHIELDNIEKRINANAINISRAIDLTSIISISFNANSIINLDTDTVSIIEEETKLSTFISTDNILSCIELPKLDKLIKRNTIFGFYDYYYEWECGIFECIDKIISFKRTIEESDNLIQTYTFISPINLSSKFEKVNGYLKTLDFKKSKNYLSIIPRKPNCSGCSVFKILKQNNYPPSNLKRLFFYFAENKLFELESIIRNSFEDPSIICSLRNICNYIEGIYKDIVKYSEIEEEKRNKIENPLLYPKYIKYIENEKNRNRNKLMQDIGTLQFVLQQRLSNLQQTKMIGGKSLEINQIPINYEQIIIAAETMCFYTFNQFNMNLFEMDLIKAKLWPIVTIGLDSTFTLIPPGFINLPNKSIYEPSTWSGIIHESIHYIFNHIKIEGKKLEKYNEISNLVKNENDENIEYFEIFDDLLIDLIILIIGFDFNITPFIISSITNMIEENFTWENFSRLIISFTFSIYYELNKENDIDLIPLNEILSHKFPSKNKNHELDFFDKICEIVSIFYQNIIDQEKLPYKSDEVKKIFNTFCNKTYKVKNFETKKSLLELFYDYLIIQGDMIKIKDSKKNDIRTLRKYLEEGKISNFSPKDILLCLNEPLEKNTHKLKFSIRGKEMEYEYYFPKENFRITNSLIVKYTAIMNLIKWQEEQILGEYKKL